MIGHTRNVNPLGGSNFSPAGNTAIATLQDVMGVGHLDVCSRR